MLAPPPIVTPGMSDARRRDPAEPPVMIVVPDGTSNQFIGNDLTFSFRRCSLYLIPDDLV